MDDKSLLKDPEFTNNSGTSLKKEILTFIFIAVCIVLPFRIFVAEPYLVDGISMSPTFETGNYLIVEKLSYKFHPPKRYDVIVLNPKDNVKTVPPDNSRRFIKRIIGLPGETIQINGSEVKIYNEENKDGFVVDSSFVKFPKEDQEYITLDSTHYFVMGDNRAESYDSRAWGALPKSDIIGRPILELWPHVKIVPGKVSI